MTTEDKAAAFDMIMSAFTHRWVDGTYSWFCLTPCGGGSHPTPEAAREEFLAWAADTARRRRRLPTAESEPCGSTSAPTSPTGSPAVSSSTPPSS